MDSFREHILGIWNSPLPMQLLRAFFVAVVIEMVVYVFNRWLYTALRPARDRGASADPSRRVRRHRLLYAFPSLATRVALYVVGILMVLRIFRLDTRAELIPIGFGLLVLAAVMARDILRDVMHGYMLIYDFDMDVNDEVTIAGYTGVVVEITLRHTRLRLADGTITAIPNAQIGSLTNHSRKPRAPQAAAPPLEPMS